MERKTTYGRSMSYHDIYNNHVWVHLSRTWSEASAPDVPAAPTCPGGRIPLQGTQLCSIRRCVPEDYMNEPQHTLLCRHTTQYRSANTHVAIAACRLGPDIVLLTLALLVARALDLA